MSYAAAGRFQAEAGPVLAAPDLLARGLPQAVAPLLRLEATLLHLCKLPVP